MAALPASPALANSCPVHTLCTWQNSGYGGTQWNLSHADDAWWFVGGAANDQISSYINATGEYAFIAKNCPADSQWTWIGPNAHNSNLAGSSWPGGGTINDSISAYAINSFSDFDIDYPIHGDRTHAGC